MSNLAKKGGVQDSLHTTPEVTPPQNEGLTPSQSPQEIYRVTFRYRTFDTYYEPDQDGVIHTEKAAHSWRKSFVTVECPSILHLYRKAWAWLKEDYPADKFDVELRSVQRLDAQRGESDGGR